MYHVTFTYRLCLPLHEIICIICNRYNLAITQIVPTLWRNICSFITTCELYKLEYLAKAFGLVHTIQEALRDAEEARSYSFNN